MENTAQDDLKAHLMATDAHYRELVAKHSEYDHKLQELEAKNALTEDEQLEEVHLKKLKLHLKDQMMDVLNRNKAQRVA
jgi:uncharacterized protein YdcH (DUF465 family)